MNDYSFILSTAYASQRKTVFRFIQFYEILEKDETIFFRREDCIDCDSQSYAVLKTEMRF